MDKDRCWNKSDMFSTPHELEMLMEIQRVVLRLRSISAE